MTSKQRAYLKSLAMTMDPIFQFGKNSLTPENTKAIAVFRRVLPFQLCLLIRDTSFRREPMCAR